MSFTTPALSAARLVDLSGAIAMIAPHSSSLIRGGICPPSVITAKGALLRVPDLCVRGFEL